MFSDWLIQVEHEHANEEGEHADAPAPASADEVPLSKVGSLFLLAERLTRTPVSSIEIFPSHEKVSRNFLALASVQAQPPVVDAVLSLGAFALYQGGGLGDIPSELEDFLMYLQTFAAISATATSPEARFLAHHHVTTVLGKHPDEAVRLAYIKDTLEHCPFESLKERVVVILKDEIIHATTESSSSIFSSPVVLEELFPVLFPDVGDLFSGSDQQNLSVFKNHYPRLVATVNFYYCLLKSPAAQSHLGVCNKEHADRVENRFLQPLAKAIEGFKSRKDVDGSMEFELDILAEVLERVDDTKKVVIQ